MIQFFVPGVPRPAGSKRAFPIRKAGVLTGRVAVVDDNRNAKDWKATVAAVAVEAYRGALLAGPIRLTVEFRMPRPKGHFRTGKRSNEIKDGSPRHPIGRPDTLKLARCLEDCLTHLVWRDDAQIVDEILLKRYADKPGAWVEIEPL